MDKNVEGWRRKSSADPERRLAAVENQRDDQVLLVAEVPGQQTQERAAGLGIVLAGAAERIALSTVAAICS